jgi:hypothetical protein
MKMIAVGTLALALAANVAQPRTALAWGDDGHKVVALIAQSFLEPDARKRVNALLAADTDSLTPHDIAGAATWADKFRDSNIGGARLKTRQWHFITSGIPSSSTSLRPTPKASPPISSDTSPRIKKKRGRQ